MIAAVTYLPPPVFAVSTHKETTGSTQHPETGWRELRQATPVQQLARTATGPDDGSGAPWATTEAFPALYCVILKVSCFLHLGDLQKVRSVLGAFTCDTDEPGIVPTSVELDRWAGLGSHSRGRHAGAQFIRRLPAEQRAAPFCSQSLWHDVGLRWGQ